ncbi:MAG TPA: cobalamin-binding protein [Pyrinomonadaceae bacterium]|nr:cobalamin-binding protein [Pyrinomonadaceae bacterium]
MFSRTSLKLLLACALFLTITSACSSVQKPRPDGPISRILTDDAGRTVAVPFKVDRVISLAPNLTEIVFAVGGGGQLVGRTSYCDFPPEAKSVAEVGDTAHPSLEKLIALKPQVVLISTASQLEVFTHQLESQNIAVFITDPHDLDGVFRSIEQIGEILGKKQQAATLVESLRKRTNAVEEAVKQKQPVRVFYQLSAEPLYTAGHDSFATDLMRRAGAISVTADVPGTWPKYSTESALAARPDAIILATGGSMGTGNSTVAEALRKSPAVLEGRVYKINDDHLVRPGPRLIDGLEEMARALHPDAFK